MVASYGSFPVMLHLCILLTLYFPMFPFDPPENIRKPKGDQKGTLGSKGLIKIPLNQTNSNLTFR